MQIVWFGVFFAVYAAAFCFFKRGSMSKRAWLPCFILGNVFGVSANVIMMILYQSMNPNLVMGLALGGGFVAAQIVIALVFRNKLTWMQIIGALIVASGMFLLVMGGASA